jgi:hypothetical protein
MGLQGNNQSKAIAKAGGKMERCAQQTHHRDPYGKPARFHPRIKGITLNNGIETFSLCLHCFFYQRRSFEDMMQPGKGFALFEQA